MKIGFVFNQTQQFSTCFDGKFEGAFIAVLMYGKGLGDDLVAGQPQSGLPRSLRLVGRFGEQYPRYAAVVVAAHQLMEFALAQRPGFSELGVAPLNGGGEGFLRSAQLQLVEGFDMRFAAPAKEHRPAPDAGFGFGSGDGVEEAESGHRRG